MTIQKFMTATLGLLTLGLFLFTFTPITHAQGLPNRTWVATTGSNSNPCSRTLPCRDFSFAITAVADGGEVIVFDSGGYGAVEITKSVQLIAPNGVHAAIAPTSGLPAPGFFFGETSAVVVNAPSATVVLRNIYINAQGPTFGVYVAAVGTLHVESCVVNGFLYDASGTVATGIDFRANGQLMVRDSAVRNNYMGIQITAPVGGVARASIDRCRFEFNYSVSVLALDRSRVAVSNTVAVGDGGGIGFMVGGNPSELNCESCIASNLGSGYYTDFGGVMRVARSVATNNTYGFDSLYGTLESLSNNTVRGNGTNTSGTIITVPQT